MRLCHALLSPAFALLVSIPAGAQPPLADSGCAPAPLVDAAFRDAALATLDGLAIHAAGKSADGAVRLDHAAGLRDAAGRAWFRISAYQANLGVIGALAVDARVLPLAAAWLQWQARHIVSSGPTRGVVLDTWVRADTLDESTCPDGAATGHCSDVDAFDSTAASTLLVADGYLRRGGDRAVLRDAAVREALEAAAAALDVMTTGDGFTIAKPAHPVVYTMDQVEVAAAWRAWARVQRDAYAQPASAANSGARAAALEHAIRTRLATRSGWEVSRGSGVAKPALWYPDTVAQAWPLLWLPEASDASGANASTWRHAVASWQRDPAHHWAATNVDPDGFWWPSVAVAAACTGDPASAARWVARARSRWLDPASPFPRPFQVGDLLWLLWLATPR